MENEESNENRERVKAVHFDFRQRILSPDVHLNKSSRQDQNQMFIREANFLFKIIR